MANMWRHKDWKNPWCDKGQSGEDSYEVAFEAGADAIVGAILKLCEELQHSVKGYDCFDYGGPTICEYHCLPGLIEILKGK